MIILKFCLLLKDRMKVHMKRKLRYKFINLKLYRKILLIFSAMLSVIAVLVILSLNLSFQTYDKKLYEKSLQELEFFVQQVNDNLDSLEELSKTIALDKEIQNKLAEMSSEKYLSSMYSYKMDEFRSLLSKKTAADSRVKNVIYTDGRQVEFTVGTYVGELEEENFHNFLKKAEEKRGGYVFQNPTQSYPYLLAGREILEEKNTSLDYLGTIAFTVDVEEIIQKSIQNLEAERARLVVYSDESILYEDEKSENQKQILSSLEGNSGYKIVKTGAENKIFMCYKKSVETGWMYVNFFPYSEIFGKTILIRSLVFAGLGIIFLTVMLLMKRVIKTLVQPLENLIESMKIVEQGKFEEASQLLDYENRSDEIGTLVHEFQIMIKTIDSLIYENYEKKLLLQKTKYKMLQSQINPHFLYNTLNTINWTIRAGKNKEASKMIMELGKILRASLSKEEYVSVENEVEIAESYVTIQQFRYKGRVGFAIEKYGNLEKYYIPKMILQPLIENSIQYGVEQSANYCKITLRVEERAQSIFMKVADEGPGMSDADLKAARNFSIQPKGHGIGLKNIYERLMIANERSKFEIYSQPGKGTMVVMEIPKERRDVQITDSR